MKKVIAFGTFDRFHLGHQSYLQQAKSLGDHLIVIIARDKTVTQIKGKLPDDDEKTRLTNVKKSKIADSVVLGEKGDKYEVLRKYKPNIIALGYDQFTFTFRLEKFLIDEKMNTKVVRLEAYRPDIYKTSLLRKQYENSLSSSAA